jgi:hypothetical protein
MFVIVIVVAVVVVDVGWCDAQMWDVWDVASSAPCFPAPNMRFVTERTWCLAVGVAAGTIAWGTLEACHRCYDNVGFYGDKLPFRPCPSPPPHPCPYLNPYPCPYSIICTQAASTTAPARTGRSTGHCAAAAGLEVWGRGKAVCAGGRGPGLCPHHHRPCRLGLQVGEIAQRPPFTLPLHARPAACNSQRCLTK